MSNKSANPHLDIAPEVQAALQHGSPVVALESTIICHGMPHPKNVETAQQVECAVRDHGAIPATIAILNGRLKVGLNKNEIDLLGSQGQKVTKTSRRDIPLIVARKEDGATTVAATMSIAAMAGIRIFATGGIGGVHRGVEDTMDISADLEELARTDVTVVCAGVKSVLDIGRTLEYLETHGVPVVGYQTNIMPAFYSRESDFSVSYRIDTPEEAAIAMKAKSDMQLGGGIVIANPVPAGDSLDQTEINSVISTAIAEMNYRGISGKDATPFLLAKIADVTEGRSLAANIALVLNNAQLAARIAVAFHA